MDWGRAKTILIFSFLALNLILGYELWAGRWNPGGAKSATADIAEELGQMLQARNIHVEPTIPKDVPKMREIVVKWVEGDQFGKWVQLPKPIPYNSLLSKGSIRELLNQMGHLIEKPEAYRFDPVFSEEGHYVLNQMYGDYPLFDINLELAINDGHLTAYRQLYVEADLNAQPNEEKKVIPAYTALRTLADKYLADGSVITDIRLGYHGQYFDSEKWTVLPAFPTWRVAVASGDVYYVHAFRGDVENAPRLRKPS